MGRKWFLLWHVLFAVAAGVLYFYCVLPRWYELMGEMPRALGMAGRIASGALIGLAALPVVFVLLRTRSRELGVPQLAVNIRVCSIVAQVLAAVLIIGTAISEIWLSLDTAGRYLFAIYGAAAAIAVLGIFGFYLSFIAELPPPPPKPIKAKKPKKRLRKKAEQPQEAETQEAEETEEAEAQPVAVADTEAAEETTEAAQEPAEAAQEPAEEPATVSAEKTETRPGLQNRRPTGKGSHRMRRRARGGIAVDE